MIGNEEWLTVGKLVAPQGLRGKIRIKPSTDFPERFTKPGKRWIQKNNKNEQRGNTKDTMGNSGKGF